MGDGVGVGQSETPTPMFGLGEPGDGLLPAKAALAGRTSAKHAMRAAAIAAALLRMDNVVPFVSLRRDLFPPDV